MFISRLNKICIFKVQGFKCQFPRDTLGCECVVYVPSSTGKDKEENNITETDSDGVGVKSCVFCVVVVVCRSTFSGCVCLCVFAVSLFVAGSEDMCNGCVSTIDTSGYSSIYKLKDFL